MATDNLKNAAEQRSAARTKYIEERVQALPNDLQSLSENDLRELVKQFHKQLTQTEESRYDFEMKIRKQDYDINELTIKVNDAKGKFIKPALKKVSKTSQKYRYQGHRLSSFFLLIDNVFFSFLDYKNYRNLKKKNSIFVMFSKLQHQNLHSKMNIKMKIKLIFVIKFN